MKDTTTLSKDIKTDENRMDRRQLLRAVSTFALGGLVVSGLSRGKKAHTADLEKIEMLPTCVGCTGCAASCPTGAIQVGWPMPTLINDRCNRCGFCEVVCPVGGRRVNPRATVR